ncbi:MAG: TonB-dependent receptor [Acidobacteria bacterium]|nr:TonB-dependent receptor [Acidobacteriota bacterium]
MTRLNGVAALLLAAASGVCGEDPANNPDGSLSGLSLEELTNLTVSSVSRREQQLSRVAAAAYIITEEEIRRSGLTSIPELLRRVPGLTVARLDANKWVVGSRGFNGRFNNKMLVLIDGRSVYNNEYSGVYWDQNDVMIEDVERIEVIRGPGATMWGANAVNGVINIITKKAKATRGGLMTARAGGDERGAGALRYGAGDGERLNYRGYVKYFDRWSLLAADGSSANDGGRALRAGGRLDWQSGPRDLFSFSGDGYRGRSSQSVNETFQTPLATMINDTARFSGGFAMGRWERTLKASDIAIQTYYNDERRSEWVASGVMRTLDFDFQQHFNWKDRHDVIWGAGYRWMHDRLSGSPPPFDPSSRTDHLFSAFLQDDISLAPDRLVLTLGTKVLHNSYTGVEVQPGVRIMWTPGRRHSFWASASRAVRTPSRRDVDLSLAFSLPQSVYVPITVLTTGNKDFESESVAAYEAGFRSQIGRRVSLDVATFVNRYSKLEETVQGTPYVRTAPKAEYVIPITFVNTGWGHTLGVETALSWNLARRWRIQGGYAWIEAHLQGPDSADGLSYQSWAWLTPKSTFSVHNFFDLTRNISFDASLYYASRLPDRDIGAYERTDLRLAWKVGEYAEFSAGVQNLGSDRHMEFSMEEYSATSAVRRSAYIQALWRF